MKVHECEKAVIGLILSHPDKEFRIAHRICAELDGDKFGYQAHRIIYNAIQSLVVQGQTPNILNVANFLKSDLEVTGGLPYLQSLIAFNKTLRLNEGFENWVQVVDAAGRLRHIGLIVKKYDDLYKDFDRLISEVTDPDDFIANFLTEINNGLCGIKSTYKHISEATNELRRRLDVIQDGGVVDLIPTGWPKSESFFIPRPFSLGVLAGLSSIGKTQMALQFGLGAAIHLYEHSDPGTVSINSLETPAWRMASRLACCLAQVDSDDLDSGRLFDNPDKKRHYYETLEYIDQLPIEYDDNPDMSSRAVLWNAIAQHNINGPRKLGITDYLQLLREKGETEELRVSGAIKNQRLISRETGSCEICISAMNNSVLLTSDKMGDLSKARYSGIVAYDADWGGVVYNPPQMRKKNIKFTLPDGYDGDTAYLILEKNRDHKVGKIEFNWRPEWTQFSDMSLGMGGEVYRRNGHLVSDY